MSERITIIPETYPALESEMYRSLDTDDDRPTEPPPPPVAVIWLTQPMARPTLVRLPWGVL